MYAIIEDSGTQIKVSEGDTIIVDLRELEDNVQTLTFEQVLLVGGGEGELKVGLPYVAGASVTADIVNEDEAGERVPVVKFRRRKNYIRRKSHRQHYIKVKITAINA